MCKGEICEWRKLEVDGIYNFLVRDLIFMRYLSGDNKLGFGYVLLRFRKEVNSEDVNLGTKGINEFESH